MTSPIKLLADQGLIWLYKKSVVGHFDSIPLISIGENHDDFLRIAKRSLELIRDYDSRRYHRVTVQTNWLVNCSVAAGAFCGLYRHRIKATEIDVEYLSSVGDLLFHAAIFAGVIVHEATHGVIRDRGIDTKPANRIQVERICRTEQNRFLKRLLVEFPELPDAIVQPFDPANWADHWRTGSFKRAFRELTRANRKAKSSQDSGRE